MKAQRSRFTWLEFQLIGEAAAILLLVAVAGCGSSDTRPVQAPPPQSASASQRASAAAVANATSASTASSFRNDLVESTQQIDRVLGALNMLTDPQTQDLRGAFDNYKAQLSRMNDYADQIRREATAMSSARNEYFAQWDRRMADVSNANIRASAEAQQAKLREAHDRIRTETLETRDAYDPFMRDLRDARTFLSNELSKQSTSMLGQFNVKAQASGATVKQKVNALIAEVDAMNALNAGT